MKISGIKLFHSKNTVQTIDCFVDNGYIKSSHGSLPDVDCDFDSTRRQEVKAYLEKRYNYNGLQRVFSAGTFTTERLKSVVTDVARIYKVPVRTVKYMTA